MGARIRDTYVHTNLCQLNLRFGPDGPIEEMVALQREFNIFSEQHSLEHAFGLLNIGPQQDWEQRQGWYAYLSQDLGNYPSDRPGVNSHDRIVGVLKENLESKNPLPVYFTCHESIPPNLGVFVTDAPPAFTRVSYLTISLPTVPRR